MPCDKKNDVRTWSKGRRGVAVAGFGLLLLLIIAIVLLSPLTFPQISRLFKWLRTFLPQQGANAQQQEQQQQQKGGMMAGLAQKSATAYKHAVHIRPYVSYAKVPLRLMIGAIPARTTGALLFLYCVSPASTRCGAR